MHVTYQKKKTIIMHVNYAMLVQVEEANSMLIVQEFPGLRVIVNSS